MIRIPKIIHFIWIGDKKFVYDEEIQSFKDHNPGWEIKLWHNDNLPKIKNNWTYDRVNSWAAKSDILRLEILEKYGGIYTDVDSKCLRPLEPLIDELTCFGMNWGGMKKRGVSNGFLGCIKHHVAYQKMVNDLDKRAWNLSFSVANKKYGLSIYSVAGARFITPYLQKSPDFVQFDYGKGKGKRELIGTLEDKKVLETGYIVQYCEGSWRSRGRIKL